MIGEREVLQLIGDPHEADRDLQEFRASAMRLSSRHPRMIERYPNQWIALHSGRVRAQDDSLHGLLKSVDKQGIPRGQAIVRFIDDQPRTMILCRNAKRQIR